MVHTAPCLGCAVGGDEPVPLVVGSHRLFCSRERCRKRYRRFQRAGGFAEWRPRHDESLCALTLKDATGRAIARLGVSYEAGSWLEERGLCRRDGQ
jgi:hypothetical protein